MPGVCWPSRSVVSKRVEAGAGHLCILEVQRDLPHHRFGNGPPSPKERETLRDVVPSPLGKVARAKPVTDEVTLGESPLPPRHVIPNARVAKRNKRFGTPLCGVKRGSK